MCADGQERVVDGLHRSRGAAAGLSARIRLISSRDSGVFDVVDEGLGFVEDAFSEVVSSTHLT